MAVIVVVKRQCLLSISGIIGVVEIQGDAGRGAFVAGDELLDQCASHAVDVAPAQRTFQAGEGGTAGQQIVCIQRCPSSGELK